MSSKSASKLKTDFMFLYKGIYQNALKKSPQAAAKSTPLQSSITVKREKESPNSKKGSRSKETKLKTRADEERPTFTSLFRSTGRLENLRVKTSHDTRQAKAVLHPRAITKVVPQRLTTGPASRGSSANSRHKTSSNIDGMDSRLTSPVAMMPRSTPKPSIKNSLSYKQMSSNYRSMFGKKDREVSKGSRSSQRKPSHTGSLSPKSKSFKPQLGKEKLTKLLQPSCIAEKKIHTETSEKLSPTTINQTKRKNSSSTSINKRSGYDPRVSLTSKNSTKKNVGRSISKLSPSLGGFSYISTKSPTDFKKETIATKLATSGLRKSKVSDEVKCVSRVTPGALSGFVTQVANPLGLMADSSKSGTGRYEARTASSHHAKQGIKKKQSESTMRLSLKNHGVFYMHKLELSFKECGEDEESSLFRQHFKQTIQSLSFLANVGRTIQAYEDRYRIEMPPLADPNETLIHCNDDQESPCDTQVPVSFPTGEFVEAGINIRPFAKFILEELSQHFEIIVFTASHACYANPVIDYLDPENRFVAKRLFREHCRQVSETLYVKDLTVLKNRKLKNLVLVDNAAYSYSLQIDNGIPVIPFYNSKQDHELRELAEFLMTLVGVPDVRPVLREKFKNHVISDNAKNMNVLFKKLFGI